MFRGSSGANLHSDRSCNKVSVGEITLVRDSGAAAPWCVGSYMSNNLRKRREKAKEDDETETMSPAMAMHCWLARMDAVEAILYRPAPAQEVAKTEPSSDGEICDLDGTDFEFFEHESYSRRAALATMLMDGEMDQQQQSHQDHQTNNVPRTCSSWTAPTDLYAVDLHSLQGTQGPHSVQGT